VENAARIAGEAGKRKKREKRFLHVLDQHLRAQ
jgi:hypothetical protein